MARLKISRKVWIALGVATLLFLWIWPNRHVYREYGGATYRINRWTGEGELILGAPGRPMRR